MTNEIPKNNNVVPEGSGFCQQPSQEYLDILSEFDEDPRSAAGAIAIADRKKKRGGAVDERNADAPAIPTVKEVVKAVINQHP